MIFEFLFLAHLLVHRALAKSTPLPLSKLSHLAIRLADAQRWYTLAKTQQERLAWELAERDGVTLQAICPPYVWGPLLSPHLNLSHAVLLELLNGAYATIPNGRAMTMVDVRDVADVHVLAYETREPGRYWTCAAQPHMAELCEIIRRRFPQFARTTPAQLAQPGARSRTALTDGARACGRRLHSPCLVCLPLLPRPDG